MIFLYRFDVIGADALTTDDAAWAAADSVGTSRHNIYLYTNFERPIPFDSTGGSLEAAGVPPVGSSGAPTVWQPLAGVESNGVELNSERSSGQMSVKVPLDTPVAQLYDVDYPNARVFLTIGTLVDADASPLIIWVGEVMSAEFDEQRATFDCQHMSQVLERQALTGKYTRTCRSPLFYGGMCGLERDKATFAGGITYYTWREDALVSEAAYDSAQLTLTIPEAANHPNGFFNGGYIMLGAEYDTTNKRHLLRTAAPTTADATLTTPNPQAIPSGGVKRSIVSHVGAVLVLATPLTEALADNTKASIFAGCNKLPDTCKSAKFNNYQRFRGYLISVQNPYESGVRPQ